MTYVEIEIEEYIKGGIGYMVHFYEMPSFEYDGYWESDRSYKDEESACDAAVAWLDETYGAKKWQHI